MVVIFVEKKELFDDFIIVFRHVMSRIRDINILGNFKKNEEEKTMPQGTFQKFSSLLSHQIIKGSELSKYIIVVVVQKKNLEGISP